MLGSLMTLTKRMLMTISGKVLYELKDTKII